MRTWTKSACVVLAWSILPIILIAIGSTRSVHPAHASARTASSTEVTLTSLQSAPAAPVTAARPLVTKYVVQYGDTLSSIAARFAVHGGWPALYAANRRAVGPDPNTIRPGTVLRLPSRTLPARYTVAAGDTLSGIAARLALPGGWLALYEANWQAIGPNPNTIHPGTVLTIPSPAAATTSSGRPSPATKPRPASEPRPATRPHLASPAISPGRQRAARCAEGSADVRPQRHAGLAQGPAAGRCPADRPDLPGRGADARCAASMPRGTLPLDPRLLPAGSRARYRRARSGPLSSSPTTTGWW